MNSEKRGYLHQSSREPEEESKRFKVGQPQDDASESREEMHARREHPQDKTDLPSSPISVTDGETYLCVSNGIIPQLEQHAPQPTHLVVENLKDPAQLERLTSSDTLRSLDLRNCDLSTSFPTSIAKMTSLQELKLAGRGLKELPMWLGQLPQLINLELTRCDFSDGLPMFIGCLSSLQRLALRNCKLTSLPKWLEQVKTLQALDLSFNDFSGELPGMIVKFTSLGELKLEGCKLTSLPHWLKDLPELQTLDLAGNNFEHQLPEVIGDCLSLTCLTLNDCHLKDLPEWMISLRNLQDLDLSGNKFKDCLPAVVGRLTNLVSLELANCKLPSLACITTLTQLRVLDLTGHDFSDRFPPEISQLVSLKELNLQRCIFNDLPNWFGTLELSSLDLTNCTFSDKLPDALNDLALLQNLSLENCNLHDVPPGVCKLNNLRSLNLSNNDFSGGLSDAIGQLHGLRCLELWNCQLCDLPPPFGELGQLEELNLDANKLRKIPSVVYDLKQLENLTIKNNVFLQQVDEKIIQLRELSSFDCEGCDAMQYPPYDVCVQGMKKLRLYFADPSGVEKFSGVPVVIIGSRGCGKQSLVRNLAGNENDLEYRSSESKLVPTMRALEERKLKFGNLTIKILTCGSQEEYPQALRHCRKCFVVAVVNLKEFCELAKGQQWKEAARKVLFDRLSHVYHACPSSKAPILVLTHADQLSVPIDHCKRELIKATESLRLTMLQGQQRFPASSGQHTKTSHLTNMEKPLFDEDEVFEISDDLLNIPIMELLREALVKRTNEFVIASSQFSDIENYLKTHDKPWIEKSELRNQFPQSDLDKCLEAMQNAGMVLWLENVQSLSGYVFPRLDVIKFMFESLSPFFSNSSAEKWEEQIRGFDPFCHKSRDIGRHKFRELVQRFTLTGLMDEALLASLLEKSEFPEEVAINLLKCFFVVLGPLVIQESAFYIVPAFAKERTSGISSKKASLQLRVDIIFEGLAAPQYIYQYASQSFLRCFPSAQTPAKVRQDGATIRYEESEIHLVHESDTRNLKLTVLSTVRDLGVSWKNLVNVVISIKSMLNIHWKDARLEVLSYCAHCLFLQDPNPSYTVDPSWSKSSTNLGAPSTGADSNVRLVPCYRSQTNDGELEPVVPKVLVIPCFCLTEDDMKELDLYLGQLQNMQPIQTKLPAHEDSDSELSDVEEQGYCDVESPSTLNLKLRKVSKLSIKQLYHQADKVYPMSHPTRGRAMIINIQRLRQMERRGSDVDCINLSRLFEKLGFVVSRISEEPTSVTTQRIYSEIRLETQRSEHQHYGMFVLVLLGVSMRGDDLLDTNDGLLDMVKIQHLLSAHCFRAMAGKPKLVVIENCTGGRTDLRDAHPGTASEIPPPLPIFLHRAESDRPTIPNTDDFMIVKSISSSWSSTHGSSFIRVLVATFYSHSGSKDVETLFSIIQHRMRLINLKLSRHGAPPYQERSGIQPITYCTFTNYRKLCLFPGFPRNT